MEWILYKENTPENFSSLKKTFLDDVATTVLMEDIPPELILNWDQTGFKMVPSPTWTMNTRGAQRVEVVGVHDKRLITAVFCGSLVGDFLPLQIIYQGKRHALTLGFSFLAIGTLHTLLGIGQQRRQCFNMSKISSFHMWRSSKASLKMLENLLWLLSITSRGK